MSRSYSHIQEYEKEIKELQEQGYTKNATEEYKNSKKNKKGK